LPRDDHRPAVGDALRRRHRGVAQPPAAGLIPANAEWSAYGHPLQIYFLVAALSLAVFLLWFNRHKSYDGQAALLFLVVDGLEKGVLESYRFAYRPGLQVAAFAMAAIGLAGLAYMASLSRNAAAASISRAG